MNEILNKIIEVCSTFLKEVKNVIKEFGNELGKSVKSLNTKGGFKKQIPNIISISRLAIFLPIIYNYTKNGEIKKAGVTAVIGFLSDGIDGFIARRYNLQSKLGAHLDAFSDKLFALFTMSLLIKSTPILAIPAFLEVSIGFMIVCFKTKDYDTKTNKIGKRKSFFLYAAICSLFFKHFAVISNLVMPLLATATLFQIATLYSYYKTYQEHKDNNDNDLNNKSNDDKQDNKVNDIELSKSEALKQFKEFTINNQSTNSINEVKNKTFLL